MLATTCAQMTTVRMDAKPILVEMRMSAVGAPDVPHIESEYAADHVVHGVDFGDQQAFPRKLAPHQPYRPIGRIYIFAPLGICPRVNMDSEIRRKASGIVDRRNSTPQADPTGILVEIKIENLLR
jgi:hypothetical protein